MQSLTRWWWKKVLGWRGWPDPEGTLDWLERRKELIEWESRR